jgi:hypothetical protein
MSYRDINNNTVYDMKRKLDYFITSGGSSDTFINSKNNVLKETELATSLDSSSPETPAGSRGPWHRR